MFIYDIEMTLKKNVEDDAFTEALQALLWPLERDNRIILPYDLGIALNDKQVSLRLGTMRASSIVRKDRFWVPKELRRKREILDALLKTSIQINFKGRELENGYTLGRVKAPFYILFWSWSCFSMLRDGETLEQLPAYQVPSLDIRTREELRRFRKAYKRMYNMWLNSHEGEAFAKKQLLNHDSPLAKRGRELCASIESQTGVQTYYYLENFRTWPQKKDRERLCPETKRDWLLNAPLANDRIHFKSDRAR